MNRPKRVIHAALLAVLVTGVWARLVHIYKFFIYPDSYYYLLLADNLRRGGRLYGRLGPRGMRFPPIGSAIFKPVFPALIALVDFATDNLEFSGRIVGIGASVGSILLIYLLGARLFGSRLTGLFSALLLAVSFNHIFWSGFIMGDSVSLFVLLAVLLAALRRDRPEYGNPLDFAAGFAFALLFLARATYVVVIPGLLWLMAAEYDWRKERWLTALSAGCAALAAIALSMLPPVVQLMPVVWGAVPTLLGALVVIAVSGTGFLLGRRLGLRIDSGPGRLIADTAFLLMIAAPVLAQSVFYPGLHRFILNDPLLCVLGVLGFVLVYYSPKRRLSIFCVLSSVLLLAVYRRAAAWEWRYLVQALPFLILPGAWAAETILTTLAGYVSRRRTLARVGAFVGLAVIALSFGLTIKRSLTPAAGEFTTESYPARVSRLARPALARYSQNTILITALPWGYYYHLRFSTWGFDERQPQKVLRYLPKKGPILVISDLPLTLQSPGIVQSLATLRNVRKVASFPMGPEFRWGRAGGPREHRVTIYELDYDQLAKAVRLTGVSP